MRLLRWLLAPFIVLAVLFVIGNVILERQAEARIAGTIRREFDLPRDPDVDLDAFPIVLRALSGSLPRLTFEASGVEAGELQLRAVRVSLEDITLRGSVLGRGPLTVRVRRGTVRADATDSSVNALLRERGEDATIAFGPSGATVRARRLIAGATRTIVASGRVVLRGRRLVFVPRSVTVDGEAPPAGFEDEARRQATVSSTLPALPGGFRVTRIAPRAGGVSLTAVVRGENIRVR